MAAEAYGRVEQAVRGTALQQYWCGTRSREGQQPTSSSTFPSLSPPPSATGDAESSSDDLAAILNFRSDMLSIRERVPMNVERRKLQRATRAVIKVTRQMGNWDSRIPIPYTEGDVAHSWMLWLPFDV
ncbi:hypothetical protein B2J93_1499 [Marssonina coronariae]|uniref:Uncharacterized protein n=1 Tax=Diplocarpon coronariae TaxID=2795749 RepID=A0A218Z1Y5_9HELO|nr:hypothetical protein B2J93_1499 [Marssonina coronariae]